MLSLFRGHTIDLSRRLEGRTFVEIGSFLHGPECTCRGLSSFPSAILPRWQAYYGLGPLCRPHEVKLVKKSLEGA